MIKRVEYTEYICDICGETQRVYKPMTTITYLHEFSLDGISLGICDKCEGLIHNFVNDMKRGEL